MSGYVRGRYTRNDSARDRTGTVWMPMGCILRNLANTIEQSVCGSDAAFCQIILTACYYYYITMLRDTVSVSMNFCQLLGLSVSVTAVTEDVITANLHSR